MVGEGLAVRVGIPVVSAPNVDPLNLEDVVDGPNNTQHTADHNHYDLHWVAHGRCAPAARLEVRYPFVYLKHSIKIIC